MFGKYSTLWQKPFVFLSAHPILHEVSRDIHRATEDEDFSNHSLTWVFCGAHKSFSVLSRLPGRKLFIQTEQLTDMHGRDLWGQSQGDNVKNIVANLKKSDVFLDLNINNGPFYDNLDLDCKDRFKIHLGPHIFPSKKISNSCSGNQGRVFFGCLNDRRRNVLKKLQKDRLHSTVIVPGNTYKQSLKQHIEGSDIILNIHFDDAVYTEVPRMLAAYLSGKVVQSELLETPFERGVHYISLENKIPSSFRDVFENFASLVSTDYSFKKFVDMAFDAGGN